MALIGTIRNNLWFVLILLGFALAAFVIMDMSTASSLGGGAGQLTLAKINGKSIDYREFQTSEQYTGFAGDVFFKRSQLWNYFVEKTLVEQEANAIGLGVSPEELRDLEFGQNLSPVLQRFLQNPQTGQVDRNQLNQIKQQIETDQMQPEFKNFWRELEYQIIKGQLQNKLNQAVSKALYMPAWMAEAGFAEQNDKVDFAYVKIPYDGVSDADAPISDADYTNYLKENRGLYSNDNETRVAEYIVFDVLPVRSDTIASRTRLDSLIVSFKRTTDDSLFAINNNGVYRNYFNTQEEIQQMSRALSEAVQGLGSGDVYGPYQDGSNFRAVKLIERRLVPDSVRARHILKQVAPGDVAGMLNAQKLIDSLQQLVERGVESFDSLAFKFSDDPGSKIKGGDLGTFQQGRMVAPFNEVAFITGKPGEYHQAITQFGIHLIHVQDHVYNKRDPKYKIAWVDMPITPSDSTQNSVFNQVDDLVTEHTSLESLRSAVADRDDITMETSSALGENDFSFANMGSGQTSRDIIKWLYDADTEADDVSADIYTYTDPVNFFDARYVIAGLSRINKAGLLSVENAKNDIHSLVLNQKKGEYLSEQIASSDLAALAATYNVEVDTAKGVSFSSRFIPGVGNEADVVGTAFNTDIQALSAPIIGKSGVFVVQPISREADVDEQPPIPQLRSLGANAARGRVASGLMESLKKNAKITDNRSTFY